MLSSRLLIRSFLFSAFISAMLFASVASAEEVISGKPQVEFQTNRGIFVVELYPDKAPASVANFLKYIELGFYDGTIFHRTIKNFVVQGGGLTADMLQKSTYSPIVNESNNGLKNEPGTIAMARAFDPDSATSQFFINLTDNKYLNFYKPDPHYIGYAVFGKVIKGLDVLQAISATPTQVIGLNKNVPIDPVIVEHTRLLDMPVMPESQSSKPTPTEITKPKAKGKKRG
ncbi:peptidylprolyl isomerase [Methyloradius palustris]|uniref:Peptidyl-prolyl cis-trans isomerase n=1 Tax=Methyloradius palustris TaxID=2778876 RepID=A0A8D5FXZ0_9PROT|nr:peptidylprolyl isomerase [Methyloradius palustris]BCM24184.1 peptidyl-prolyl cis-trans isomerase [Methyloradius palustris]